MRPPNPSVRPRLGQRALSTGFAGRCPPRIASLTPCQAAARSRDEIGLHVHWGNHAQLDGSPVDLYDRRWVEREVRATTESLAREAGRAIVSFRSGGHTLVPGLPGILEGLGYQFDGSVEDRRSTRTRRVHSLLGITTDAYAPDPTRACQVGDTAI